jgi:hypothetical protein
MELIQPFGFKKETRKEIGWLIRNFFSYFVEQPLKVLNMRKLLKMRGMLYSLKENPVFLDSKKIPPDFIDEISKRNCAVSGNCESCDYCQLISKKTYTINKSYKEECLALYEKVFDQLA